MGGPIIKDKAFFFVNYEGLRFVTSPVTFTAVPNAAYENAVIANLTSLGAPLSSEIPFYQHLFSLYNNAPGAANAQSLTPTRITFM